MPSYLGEYRDCASGRDWKIVRAVNSVIEQTFQDFELIIVADGCDKTIKIITKNFSEYIKPNDDKIILFEIPKQKIWSGIPRNTGLGNSRGEWNVYLDVDDMFSPTHLEKINQGIEDNPNMNWVYFNEYSYDERISKQKGEDTFTEHYININQRGKCGTSNIAHKKNLQVRWPIVGNYQHDWRFIQTLRNKCKQYCEIPTPGYCVCHVRGLLDV